PRPDSARRVPGLRTTRSHRVRRCTARALRPRRHRGPAPRPLPGCRRARAGADAARPLRPASPPHAGRSGRGGERRQAPPILRSHLEGPFIAPERLGTQPADARRDPDCALLERLLEAGPVSHVTLAPELPGAYDLVDLLQARGVTVSYGHTDATAAEARDAFTHGVKTVTHIFNAMRP